MTREQSIIGTYTARAPCVTVTLVVKQDHSFVQSVRTYIGETNELKGHWIVDKMAKFVVFRPFLDFSKDSRGRPVELADGPVERLLFETTMGPKNVLCPDSMHQMDFVK